MTDVARRLGTSPHAVGKVAKAYLSGGDEAVDRLKWGGGRPIKQHGLTQMEIDDIVSKPRLVDEIGMSLEAKACKVTHETGKLVNAT